MPIDGTTGGGAEMDESVRRLLLMTGRLEGTVNGLKDRLETLVDQHAEKANKDGEFRHHVYNELQAGRELRGDVQRLTTQVADMTRRMDRAANAEALAQSAHARINGIDERLKPIENRSLAMTILRSGTFQVITAVTAIVGAVVAVAQAYQGHQ